MFLFSLVCERELSLYYPISEILVYGLLKSLKSFSGKTKCLIDDEVFMAINLIAAYVKMLHYKKKKFFFLTHYLHKKKKFNLKTYNSTLLDIYGISVGEKLKKIL